MDRYVSMSAKIDRFACQVCLSSAGAKMFPGLPTCPCFLAFIDLTLHKFQRSLKTAP